MRRAAWVILACLVLTAVCAGPARAAAASAPADEHDHDSHEDPGHGSAPGPAPVAAADDHDHERGTAPAPALEAHDEHAHDPAADTAGTPAADDHSHDEAAHDEGHSHGVDALSLAELAAELGSVDAALQEACSAVALQGYDLGLHIGAIFILLAVSALGAVLPVVLHVSSKSSTVLAMVKMGTYFGFGTILSTAFIHMLLPAARNLNSPCLAASWNERYEAWAYLFVVLSIVFMQLIDYLMEGAYQRYIERRGAQPHTEACEEQAHNMDEHTHHAAVVGAIASMHTSKAHLAAAAPPASPRAAHAHVHAHSDDLEAAHDHDHDHDHSHSHGHSHGSSSGSGKAASELQAGAEGGDGSEEGAPCRVHGPSCTSLISHEPQHKTDPSQVVGIYLMEAGIVFHSVLIGITLGVTSGSAFSTLLVALSFHQFFEGFAIGSAVVDSGLGALRSLLMGAVYAVTTPTGIAIGIGMRESFNQNAETTLMVQGIFDAISTGILIYVVLVELINPLMTQSAWLRSRRWWVQALCFAAFYGGVTVMAVIGKYA